MAEKNKYLDDLIKAKTEESLKLKVDKEKFKNAFLEAELIFSKHVKTKKLRDLINFKDQIDQFNAYFADIMIYIIFDIKYFY